jgi:hypothetical protein
MGHAAAARRLQAEMRRIYRPHIVPRIERYGTQARVLSQICIFGATSENRVSEIQ